MRALYRSALESVRVVESLGGVDPQERNALAGNQPFVPVGPGWGLILSPGPNGTFNNADDVVMLARY